MRVYDSTVSTSLLAAIEGSEDAYGGRQGYACISIVEIHPSSRPCWVGANRSFTKMNLANTLGKKSMWDLAFTTAAPVWQHGCFYRSFVPTPARATGIVNDDHGTAMVPGLVTPQWLEEELGNPDLVVLDIRGEVEKGPVDSSGFQTYRYTGLYGDYVDAHIPGAAFVDWTTDIAHTDQKGIPVQLLPKEQFQTALESKGVSLRKHVVIYDEGLHLFATRLWWALKLYGHPRVSILNGGWKRWLAEGRPVSADAPCPLKVYEPWEGETGAIEEISPHGPAFLSRVVDADWVLENCVQAPAARAVQLVDARSAVQYRGEVTRSGRSGHIPRALNLPYKDLLGPSVTDPRTSLSYRAFKSPEECIATLKAAGVDLSRPCATSCNGGVASTVPIFVLNQLLGLETFNFDGSWNEWGKRQDLPIESTANS